MGVRQWTLWSQRPILIIYCFLVVLIALAATLAVIGVPVTASDFTMLGFLAVLGVVQAESGRQVERVRRRIAGTTHINMTSVWILPAVLLLPPALAAVLVVVLHWHLRLRSWYRLKQVPAFRTVGGTAICVLTCYVTRATANATGVDGAREAIHAGWAGVAAIAVAIGTYFTVDAILIIPMLNTRRRSIQDLIGDWGDNLLELATLCLGALTALALVVLPAIAVLVVPPLFLLHRAVLISQLESAARRDGKTGVLSSAGWHRIAYQELAAAERKENAGFGVLMIDLDHFKRINDTHGHLAGDAVLKAVADTISATVRNYDSVGRFGGEEFVVLLPDMGEAGVRAVAERIRVAITRLEVTVSVADTTRTIADLTASIGIATYPKAGAAIERLLQAADSAMYRAKTNGRNQVASCSAQSI